MIDAAAALSRTNLTAEQWRALSGYQRRAAVAALVPAADIPALMAAIDAHIAEHPGVGLADPRGDALRLFGGIAGVAAALGATAWVLRRRAPRANPNSIPLPGETDEFPRRPSKWDDPSTSDEFEAARKSRWIVETAEKYDGVLAQVGREQIAAVRAVSTGFRRGDMVAVYDALAAFARTTQAARYLRSIAGGRTMHEAMWVSDRAEKFSLGKKQGDYLRPAELRGELEKRAVLAERYFRARATLYRRPDVEAASAIQHLGADPAKIADAVRLADDAVSHFDRSDSALRAGDSSTGQRENIYATNIVAKALEAFGLGTARNMQGELTETDYAVYGDQVTLRDLEKAAVAAEKVARAKPPGRHADPVLESLEESALAGELNAEGEKALAKARGKERRRLEVLERKGKLSDEEMVALIGLRSLPPT